MSHNHVGVFQPLTVTQSVDRDDDWTVAELGAALQGLEFPPLDQPYR